MEVTKERLLAGARNLKNKGYSKEQVDAWLKTKNSSLDEMRDFAKTVQESKQQKSESQQLTPLTEDQKAKSKMGMLDTATNFVKDFSSGFGEGSLYGAERIANGATLGMYDKVMPYLGNDSKERARRVEGYGDAVGHGDAIRNTGKALDVLGSLYPTTKIFNVTSKFAKPVMAFATASGIEQGARNALDSRSAKDAALKGVVGFGEGFIEGGTLGMAGKLAKGAYYLTKGATQRGLNYLKKEIGEETLNNLINQAKEQGRTLVEMIDDKIGGVLNDIQGKSKKANELIKSRISGIKESAKDKVSNFMDDFFGKTLGFENVDAVKEAVDRGTKPLFETVYNVYGDIAKKAPEVTNYIKNNDVIKDIVKTIKKDLDASPLLKNLPETDMRFIEAIRQNLSNKSKILTKEGAERYKKEYIDEVQKTFLNKVKQAVPEYGQALDAYNMFHKVDEATAKSAKFFQNSNPKKFAKEFNALSNYEQEAYRLGVKEEMQRMIGGKSEKSAWDTFLSPNNREKIKTVFGEEKGKKLIKFAEDESKRVARFKNAENTTTNEPTGGKPWQYTKYLNQAIDIAKRASLKDRKTKYMGIADLLTSSENLGKALENNSKYLPVEANKYLQEKLGKDYLPVSALLGIEWFNNKK